jgi:hypothetical protein
VFGGYKHCKSTSCRAEALCCRSPRHAQDSSWVADLGTDSSRQVLRLFDSTCAVAEAEHVRAIIYWRGSTSPHDCTTAATAAGSALIALRRSPLAVGTKQDAAGRSRAKQIKDEAGRASMSTRLASRAFRADDGLKAEDRAEAGGLEAPASPCYASKVLCCLRMHW